MPVALWSPVPVANPTAKLSLLTQLSWLLEPLVSRRELASLHVSTMNPLCRDLTWKGLEATHEGYRDRKEWWCLLELVGIVFFFFRIMQRKLIVVLRIPLFQCIESLPFREIILKPHNVFYKMWVAMGRQNWTDKKHIFKETSLCVLESSICIALKRAYPSFHLSSSVL